MTQLIRWLKSDWERILGWAALAVGATLLVIGSACVANARFLADQLSYLMSMGLAGLACVALGAGLLVTGAFHDEWYALHGIEDALRSESSAAPTNNGSSSSAGRYPAGAAKS